MCGHSLCSDCTDGQAGSEGKSSEGNRNSLSLQKQQVRGQGNERKEGIFIFLSVCVCVCYRNILQLIQPFEEENQFLLVFKKMHGGLSDRQEHLGSQLSFLFHPRSPVGPHTEKKEVCGERGSRGDKGSGHSSGFPPRERSRTQRPQTSECSLSQQGPGERFIETNILLAKKLSVSLYFHQITPVRICDFDLSSMVVNPATPTKTPILFTPVGSAEFMAPEVVETFTGDAFSYDKKCDLWSLGVSFLPPYSSSCLLAN